MKREERRFSDDEGEGESLSLAEHSGLVGFSIVVCFWEFGLRCFRAS